MVKPSKKWYPNEPPIGTRYWNGRNVEVWMGWAERIESKKPAELPEKTPDAPVP